MTIDTEFLRQVKTELESLLVTERRSAIIERLDAMIAVAESEEKIPYYQR